MHVSLTELNSIYVFPILNATAVNDPHHASQLASVQCGVINMMHTLFAVCSTEQAIYHALALSLTVPHLRKIWEDAQNLGLPTPLESPVILH